MSFDNFKKSFLSKTLSITLFFLIFLSTPFLNTAQAGKQSDFQWRLRAQDIELNNTPPSVSFILEIKSAIENKYRNCEIPQPIWGDGFDAGRGNELNASFLIRATHIYELRRALKILLNNVDTDNFTIVRANLRTGMDLYDRTKLTPFTNDSYNLLKDSPISRKHIIELRDAVDNINCDEFECKKENRLPDDSVICPNSQPNARDIRASFKEICDVSPPVLCQYTCGAFSKLMTIRGNEVCVPNTCAQASFDIMQATPCPSDTTDLTNTTTVPVLVGTSNDCTSNRKCEYYCSDGQTITFDGKACENICINLPAGAMRCRDNGDAPDEQNLPSSPMDFALTSSCTDRKCEAVCDTINGYTLTGSGYNQTCTPPECNTEYDCSDDTNDCTTKACIDGACEQVNNTASCNDGNECTVNDTCSGGVCSGTNSGSCSVCVNSGDCPVSADVCKTATCINGACEQVNNTASCDDGNECTINDTCSGGTCTSTPMDCNDNDSCTDESCINGICVPTDNGSCGSACNTVNDCPIDPPCDIYTCESNGCVLRPIDCNDNNVCTTDSCDSSSTNRRILNNDTGNTTYINGCINAPVPGCTTNPEGCTCPDLDSLECYDGCTCNEEDNCKVTCPGASCETSVTWSTISSSCDVERHHCSPDGLCNWTVIVEFPTGNGVIQNCCPSSGKQTIHGSACDGDLIRVDLASACPSNLGSAVPPLEFTCGNGCAYNGGEGTTAGGSTR